MASIPHTNREIIPEVVLVKPIWKQPYGASGEEGDELWLGVPSWDSDNKEGKLSIKFAYRKNGRIPRTAPEVPENVVVDMVVMLAEHGRLSSEDLVKLEGILLPPRKLGPPPPIPLPGKFCSSCGLEFTEASGPWWCGFCQTWFCQRKECHDKHPKHPFPM
jgi:hypothetical protein